MIGAGEQSGELGLVLERLADDLEERQALQQKLIGAALYPAIVTLVAIVIVIFLVTYVVPQVAQVFASTKRALPFLTIGDAGASATSCATTAGGCCGAVVRRRRRRAAARWRSEPSA